MVQHDQQHEDFKKRLIEDVFGERSENEKAPIEKVTLLIWHFRDDPRVVSFLARFIAKYSNSRDIFDGLEFYLPQLAHMIIHLEVNWDDAVLERFALIICQQSLHFALQLNWILQGSIEDYQPETRDGEPNPSFNVLYYTRCVKLLSKLELSVVYGRPRAHELQRLYEKGKISKKEYDDMELADRRFHANQIMEGEKSMSKDQNETFGGWLLYKRRARQNWHRRKQWKKRYFEVSDQMLYCHNDKPEGDDWSTLRRAMPLEGADVRITLHGKYPHMFEVHNQYYMFRMRAESKEEMDKWMTTLREESELSALFSHKPMSFDNSEHIVGASRELKENLVHDLNPEERARYMFFKEERMFVRAMCDVAEMLRFRDRDERKKLAPGFMEKLDIPLSAYVPMCNNTDGWRRVVKFIPKSTKVFNTKERCPVIMTYVVEKGLPDHEHIDVASYLHQKYDMRNETQIELSDADGTEHDGDLFHSVLAKPEVKSVWSEQTDNENDDAHDNATDSPQRHETTHGNKRFQSVMKEIHSSQLPKFLVPSKRSSLSRIPSRKLAPTASADLQKFPHRSIRIIQTNSAIDNEDAVENYDLIDADALKRAKTVVCGGESWSEKSKRMLAEEVANSPTECINWEIGVVMAKSNDDVRQEVFVMQMIHFYHSVFINEGLPIFLKTYRILSTSKDTGFIEFLKDATSIHGLKSEETYPSEGGMLAYFRQAYGSEDSASFQAAQHNFMVSLVGYSLVSYLLGLKDRHNGNIMIDTFGHLIHIDFGFAFGMAPGHEFSLERAPFKLTSDYMGVLGGENSKCFAEFKRLFVAGFEAARTNSQVALGLVEIMMYQSNYPCFSGSRYGGRISLERFKDRLMLNVPDEKIKKRALQLIEASTDAMGTSIYDKFQLSSNGILP